jgi:transcriptional regulator with XRE-family HTH domain
MFERDNMQNSDAHIKKSFGKALRLAREAKEFSRANLALRLSVSPVSIASWEMGRTFIERLDLLPRLESELDISIPHILAESLAGRKLPPPSAEPLPSPNSPKAQALAKPKAGPFAVTFHDTPTDVPPYEGAYESIDYDERTPAIEENASPDSGEGEREKALSQAWLAVPEMRFESLERAPNAFLPTDKIGGVLIPKTWITPKNICIAVRMPDGRMHPEIPDGAQVILDIRPYPLEKRIGCICALQVKSLGLYIRRLRQEEDGSFWAMPSDDERWKIPMNADDKCIGFAIAMLSKINGKQ